MRAWCLAAGLLVACGAEPTQTEESPSEADDVAAPEPIEARFGGVLVELEKHTVELVAHETGELHLHVRSAADLSGAGATVTLPDEAGESHSVALEWADDVQGFIGHVDATMGEGEAEVLVVLDGHRLSGAATIARALPHAAHDGSVLSVGGHVVEVSLDHEGHAHVYVLDDAEHHLDLDLTLNVPDEDGHLHPLALHWEEDHYEGHVENLHAAPGPLEVILSDHGQESLGHGTLLGVGLARPDGLGPATPEGLQLEMPALGSNLPSVIPIPDSEG